MNHSGARSRSVSLLVAAGIGLLSLTIPAAPAKATVYVVDQGHPAADDRNPGTEDKPFKTISAGASVVKPGDTVLVKGGVYREVVELKTAGAPDKRITLKAAPGQRVVVTGAGEITGWRKCTKQEARGNPAFENLYVADLERQPGLLCQGNRTLRVSRWPTSGWLPAPGGDARTVVDAERLTQPDGSWTGATLAFRIDKGKSIRESVITGYDAAKHELTTDKPRGAAVEPGKDLYWIENAVAAIDGPGQYAIDSSTQPPRVYLWPLAGWDANREPIQYSRQGPHLATWGAGVGFLTFDGLEVAFAGESGIGSSAEGGHDIEILNCVLHHDGHSGIGLYNQTGITIRHCLSTGSKYGAILGTCRNVRMEENEFFGNLADGFSVSHKSDHIQVIRNYIHNQWWDDHPDGFQAYVTVTNLLVQDNLIMNAGQGVSTGDVDGVQFINNVFVGQHHTGVSVSHDTTHNLRFLNNTVAYSGFWGLTFGGRNGVIRNNIILTGGDRGLVQAKGENLQCDYNLYWKPEAARHNVPAGQDAHSKTGDPKFRSAPPLAGPSAFAIDQWTVGRMEKCTTGRLDLMGGPLTRYFAVGDWLEVNLDGRARRVTAVADDHVAFDPPLARLHPYGWDTLVNWKARKDFSWDLRLANDSPGRNMGDDGKDVGSSIDIQAYLRGDFNGDGKRDLPEVPKDVGQ